MEHKKKKELRIRSCLAGTCIFYADISPVVCVFESFFGFARENTGPWLAFDF